MQDLGTLIYNLAVPSSLGKVSHMLDKVGDKWMYRLIDSLTVETLIKVWFEQSPTSRMWKAKKFCVGSNSHVLNSGLIRGIDVREELFLENALIGVRRILTKMLLENAFVPTVAVKVEIEFQGGDNSHFLNITVSKERESIEMAPGGIRTALNFLFKDNLLRIKERSSNFHSLCVMNPQCHPNALDDAKNNFVSNRMTVDDIFLDNTFIGGDCGARTIERFFMSVGVGVTSCEVNRQSDYVRYHVKSVTGMDIVTAGNSEEPIKDINEKFSELIEQHSLLWVSPEVLHWD